MAKVVVHCPEVRLPDDLKRSLSGKKRKTESEEYSKDAIREQVGGYLREIKDLSATSFKGLQKKKYKDDILTKLGAPPPKEQKMPFAMKMGIEKGRKRRDAAIQRHSKEAGVVLPGRKQIEKEKKSDRPNRSRDNFDVKLKKGLLHVKPLKKKSSLKKGRKA